MLSYGTVNEIFASIVARGEATVMRAQSSGGNWQAVSAARLYGHVRALAETFLAWGVNKGDRVAILSETRWEWAVTDFAALAIGVIDVPLYPTLTPEQVGYMLRDSGAKAVVVSTAEQYAKVKAAGPLPELKHIVVMEEGTIAGTESFATIMAGATGKEEQDPVFNALVAEAKPTDLLTIIYTSGTTGEPKGVMLTHGNLATNINYSMSELPNLPGDTYVSFLPLSHIFARHADYALLAEGTVIAYCPRLEQLTAALKVVRPAIFIGVPRVYEKIKQGVEAKSSASKFKASISKWAMATGSRHRAEILAGKTPSSIGWKIANKLVYSKVAEAFGGQTRMFVSGGAALGDDTAEWFANIGVRIFEGYGLTETSPVIAMNSPQGHRMGSVGRTLPNVDCRFAEDDELEVKGPSVFSTYWNKAQETTESFTPDGWFKTGDIGKIDSEGFLSITDRKKELLKTSGGKLIAPQPIENKLKANAFVSNAALVGDKHKFLSVLISPNLAALRKWAAGEGVEASDPKEFVRHAKVTALYKKIVSEVNGTLPNFERIKRVCVVPDEWSVDDGVLTPSMKLKRRVVTERYSADIAAFYKDEATASR